MSQPPCPDVANLQALLEDGTGSDEAHVLEVHLETCVGCQQTLLTLAADPGAWEDAARGLGKQVRQEPALRGVVQRLIREEHLGADDDLSFLRPADRPDLLGLMGPYEVEEEIGRGGMGVVLKAHDPALQRTVALKVLSPQLAASATARRRFVREGRSAAAVSHEHIVTVHGVDEANGLPYLVMQWVAGESLQDHLDRAGPLEVKEVVRLGAQTAAGLAAAHAHKLIHRDVKPANILLEEVAGGGWRVAGEEGGSGSSPATRHPPPATHVKLTDFGLARLVDDVGLTQNGVVAGTPEYMAPEQARGEPVDHRADLFSLGSVLYALCTGASPFHGSTTAAVLHKVCEQEPVPLRSLNPEVPAWLEDVIARLLAKGPADRFQSAGQVVDLLEGYLAHLRQPAVVTPPELPQAPAGGTFRRLPFSRPAGILACLLTGLALGIIYLFAGAGEPASGEAARELYLPLKGIGANQDSVELIGPEAKGCVTYEPDGVRLTLPAGFAGERPGTGVRIPVAAHGDFEVTIHYEVLAEREQAAAGQRPTKFTFQAQLDRRDWTVASIARRVTSDKGTQLTSWTVQTNNGNRQTRARQHATQGKVGRLRIVRTGSEASFYAAEGADPEFALLPPPRAFGDEDLKAIELVGSTGGPQATLDVRLTDLRVKASPDVASSSSDKATRRSTRFALILVLAALPVLGFLGARLLVRPRRRDRQGPSAEAPAPLAFRCPGCNKGLKARAELAGKKLKCPGCGTLLGVPLAKPAEPSQTRAVNTKVCLLVSLGLATVSLLVLCGVWLMQSSRSLTEERQERAAQQAEQAGRQIQADQQGLAPQQTDKKPEAEPGAAADRERPANNGQEKVPVAAAPDQLVDAPSYQEPFKGPLRKPLDCVLLGPNAGKFVKFEAEGLRINLPVGVNQAPLGLATAFGVRGDFDISVRYEVLAEPRPADAGTPNAGTRISLTVNLDTPQVNEAAIRRKVTPTQSVHILAWRSLLKDAGGKPDNKGHIFPVKEKVGRLRLVRSGATIAYFLSEGVNQEFTLLTTQPFGADDVKDVQIYGQTSSSKAALDVRLTDLHIAAASLVRHPEQTGSKKR